MSSAYYSAVSVKPSKVRLHHRKQASLTNWDSSVVVPGVGLVGQLGVRKNEEEELVDFANKLTAFT